MKLAFEQNSPYTADYVFYEIPIPKLDALTRLIHYRELYTARASLPTPNTDRVFASAIGSD